jgi:hypothetical protein
MEKSLMDILRMVDDVELYPNPEKFIELRLALIEREKRHERESGKRPETVHGD